MDKNDAEEKLNKNTNNMKFFSDEKFPEREHYFANAFKEQLPRQIVFIAVIVVLIIFLFLNLSSIGAFLRKIIDILTPIILGWVFTFVMAPVYNFLVDKFSNTKSDLIVKFAKPLATIVTALALLGALVGLIFLFVPQLYSSILSFISRSDTYIKLISDMTGNMMASSNNGIAKQIIAQIEKIMTDLSSSAGNFDVSRFFAGVYNGFYVSLRAIINFFVAFIVMIYSLNMKEELCYGLKRILFAVVRKDYAKKILAEVRFAKSVFSGFLSGKILDSLIIGIICYICCAIMRMPYTPLIAVIVGITNIIPFFGPFIGAIPSFVLILLEGPFSWKPYGFLVFILILQQIDGNIIGPKILGDKTGVGSFWVLFSILLFGGLFGFVGMIIAVPLWAVITRLLDEFIITKLKEKQYPLSVDEYKRLKEYNETLTNSEDKA